MQNKFISLLALTLVMSRSISPSAPEQPSPVNIPKLPTPSGSFGVGRMAFDWIDPSRPPDMAQDRGAHTELMVYVWYPTDSASSEAQGTLFPGAKQFDSATDLPAILKEKPFGGNWPLVASGAIKSHAQENAPIAKRPKTFPLMIFTPGAFGTGFQYTAAIEDLVSHGYVVASVEHTSEVLAVAFSDGTIHAYNVKLIPSQFLPPRNATREEYQAKLEAWYRHCVDVRAADLSFVLDKLIQVSKTKEKSSQLSRRLDIAHVAAVGHSRGGWASIVACRRDDRFKACVNEDGNAGGQGLQFPGETTPKQSILYVELDPVLKPGTTQDDWIVLKMLHLTAEEWVQKWHQTVESEFRTFPAGGYFVQLSAPGLEHYSFSDEVLFRAAKAGSKEQEAAALQGLSLTEEITRSFLDEVLKGEKNSRLHDDVGITVKHFEPHH